MPKPRATTIPRPLRQSWPQHRVHAQGVGRKDQNLRRERPSQGNKPPELQGRVRLLQCPRPARGLFASQQPRWLQLLRRQWPPHGIEPRQQSWGPGLLRCKREAPGKLQTLSLRSYPFGNRLLLLPHGLAHGGGSFLSSPKHASFVTKPLPQRPGKRPLRHTCLCILHGESIWNILIFAFSRRTNLVSNSSCTR